jgi:hypothetical protein
VNNIQVDKMNSQVTILTWFALFLAPYVAGKVHPSSSKSYYERHLSQASCLQLDTRDCFIRDANGNEIRCEEFEVQPNSTNCTRIAELKIQMKNIHIDPLIMIDVIIDLEDHHRERVLQPNTSLQFDVVRKEINICDVSMTEIFMVEVVANYLTKDGTAPLCNKLVRKISLKSVDTLVKISKHTKKSDNASHESKLTKAPKKMKGSKAIKSKGTKSPKLTKSPKFQG